MCSPTTAPLPCRVRDPDCKGKVESGVGHARRTHLSGMRFESIEAAHVYLDRWEAHWAYTRIHGTTKRQVAVMFAEEKPHLQPLPVEPFRYYQDRPSRTPTTTEGLLRRARGAGQHVGAVCEHIHRHEGETGIRRILGVLSLAKKHGAPTVDLAAKMALDLGATW